MWTTVRVVSDQRTGPRATERSFSRRNRFRETRPERTRRRALAYSFRVLQQAATVRVTVRRAGDSRAPRAFPSPRGTRPATARAASGPEGARTRRRWTRAARSPRLRRPPPGPCTTASRTARTRTSRTARSLARRGARVTPSVVAVVAVVVPSRPCNRQTAVKPGGVIFWTRSTRRKTPGYITVL